MEIGLNDRVLPPEEIRGRRWKEARAGLKEVELREEGGELIHFEKVEQLQMDVAVRIRLQRLNLPGRRLKEIAAETDLGAVKEIRDEAVREILEELSEGFGSAAAEEGT